MNEVSKSKFFWEEFSAGKLNLRVALGRLEISDAEKDEMCQVWSAVSRADEEASRGGRGAPLSEIEMMAIAWAELKVPYWYVRWWYCEMAKTDWMTTHGLQIDGGNWKRLLVKWWANVREDMREWMRKKYEWHEEREEETVAGVAKVPRLPVVTAHHWYECQRTCKKFQAGRCTCGYRVPAVLFAANFGATERCAQFEPVPSEWQNEWVLDAEVWEPHWVSPSKTWPKGYEHAGFKMTAKGQAVKAYFDAHPDELEEAKARNDLNEPTEDECKDVDRYLEEVLAWNKLSKAEREAGKEAGKD